MIKLKTRVPGPKSYRLLRGLKAKNGGWSISYPVVFSGEGEGPYFKDLDGNTFLDFASQIASNPMGYNHPEMLEVVKNYSQRFPVKFAGQDFAIAEHLGMLENLAEISPAGMDTAFLINSGAEAVENAIKICMRKRPGTKFGISMQNGWHGRTLGALSLTNSNKVHKKGYMRLPTMRLPFDDSAPEELERIISSEATPDEIGFVILEHVQGEGGYVPASPYMVEGLRRVTKQYGIPYIADEVQSGMGRTGKWWAFENYHITPDAFSSAKALQVGAVVSRKDMFPAESGSISSTWGGGHVLDLALGMKTIELIKKHKLLEKNRRNGDYLLDMVKDMSGISGQRGLGMMVAFDLPDADMRDNLVTECAKRGMIVLGCGSRSVRLIPPYVAEKDDLELGCSVLDDSIRTCTRKGFSHTGSICEFIHCGKHHA